MRSFIPAVAALGLASRVVAVDFKCANEGICFGLGIPDVTATEDGDDIYFQLTAPDSASWVSLGQGSQMDGANMFVVYPSSDGKNVTVSSRLGNGHNAPELYPDAQLSLLDGSGVSNGQMIANVRCSNCLTWPGGRMDFSSASADWIWGVKYGETLNSDNPDESILEHDDYGGFAFDFFLARIGESLNPFQGSDQYNNITEADFLVNSGSDQYATRLIVHGVLASVAFVALFPLGAIIVRLLHFQNLIKVHAAIQVFSYLVYVAGAGLGIWLAIEKSLLSDSHVIIGLLLLGLFFFQPLLGQLHHIMFKKHHRRTIWSQIHIWLGRAAILLGIVNGGLGLDLADNTSTGRIVYIVVAALAGVTYIAAIAYGEWRRTKTMTKSTYHSRSPHSEEDHVPKVG